MTRKRKILIISAAIIFCLLVGGYFLLQSVFMLNKVRGIVVTQLTNQLGTEVKLGRLSGNLLSGIKIADVAIADKTAPGQTIISVEELVVKYQLSKLILRTIAIKELTLQKPVIHATVDEQGNMNLAELIPKPKPEVSATSATDTQKPPKKFPFLIQAKEFELVDGHIFYQDKLHNIDANISGISIRVSGPFSPWNHKGKVAFRDATIEVNDVQKQIGTFDLDFHFTQENGKLERLRLEMENSWLEARANTNFKSTTLQANVNGLIDLKDIASFSPLTESLEGIVRLDVSTDGSWDAPTGNLTLTVPTVSFNSMNVADVSVDADFTKDSVNLTKLSANIADGNILATAQAQITDGEPDYDAQVSLTSISIQPLLSVLSSKPGKQETDNPDLSGLPSITGTIQGEMKVNGKGRELNRLNTEGQLEFKDITFNGVKMLPSIIDYTLANEQLSVKANLDKIQAEINGKLGLTTTNDLKVNLTSIDLSRLVEFALPDFKMAGMGALQANITGDLTKPEAEASLTIADITMLDAHLGGVKGKFLYSENHLRIDELMLRNANTRIIVQGSVTLNDNPTVDLKVALNPLDLSEYTALAGTPLDLKGQMLGEIAIQGPFTALNGGGELVTQDMQAFSLPIDMTMPIKLKQGILEVPKLTLKTTGGELHISAIYNPKGEYEFQLNSEDLDLASIFEVFGVEQLTGYSRILASGKGMISKPKADIQLNLTSIQYGDIKIGDVAYNGYFDTDKIQFNAAALADTFKLEGEINATHPMPFDVKVQLANLDFGALLGADENSAKISGETTGVFNVTGEIANIMQSNATIQLQAIDLRTPSHRFFNTKSIDIEFANGTIEVKQFELFQKLALERREGMDDKLYSALALTGRFALPLPGGKGFDTSLFGTTQPKGQNNQVGHPDAIGEEFDFTVQANELDLSVLNDFIGGPQFQQAKAPLSIADISGVGKFNLHLKGSYSNPEFVFHWEFPEIAVATSVLANNGQTLGLSGAKQRIETSNPKSSTLNLPINSSGNITYRDKLLTIDPIQLALYKNPLTLKGAVPVDLTSLIVKPPQSNQPFWQQLLSDSPMRLELIAPNWDIHFMEQFSADIEKISGYTNVNVEVSGSPISPQLSGNILLSDIYVQSSAIPQPLENLSASINVKIDLSKVKALNQDNVPWLACTLDSLQWNIGPGHYATSASVEYRLKTPHTPIASWFNADSLNAIKDNMAKPEVELTFVGQDIDLGAFAMGSREASNAPGLPFDGRTSVFVKVNGTGIKPQDYTAKVEIEPLVLTVGDYDWRNDEKISLTFQDGQLKFDPIILKSQLVNPDLSGKAEPVSTISLGGSANLDGHFNLKMLIDQFNLKMLSPFLADVPPLDGLVSIQLDASGTPTEPSASASFEAQNIKVKNISAAGGDINVDAIAGSIALEKETLTVNPTSLRIYDNEFNFHGSIPLNLAMLSKTSLTKPAATNVIAGGDKQPEPMQIFITGENIDLSAFASLSPMVEAISGKANINLALQDHQLTSNSEAQDAMPLIVVKPYLTGNLTMTDGRIKLVNLDTPIEAVKFDLVARQLEQLDTILAELSFQLGAGKYAMTSQIQLDGLMPKQYDGTLKIEKFPLDIVARNFLTGEAAEKLSGHLSMNAETKVNVKDLLNIPPNLQLEQKLWKLMEAAMGSKIELPEIKVQMEDYTIYNVGPVIISLDDGILSLPGWKLDYARASGENAVFLRAYGNWNPSNQLAFEFKGSVDTKMIADLTQLSNSLSELTKSSSEPPLSGLVEYRVSVRGSASEPQITISWALANLEILGSDMELSPGEISFEHGAFNVKEIKLVTEKTDIEDIPNINTINVTGRVPFNLSLMPPDISPSQDELDLQISVSIEKFDSLPLLAVQNATIDGNGKINIKVIGPIQAPQFFGDVTLKDFVYQYENVSMTDTDVKLTLDRDSINIEQAQGKFNEGLYQSWGKISLSGYKLADLNISGNWNNVKWEQEGFVSATSEGSVQLLGTFDKPRLVGNATVNRGKFEQSWQTVAMGIVSGQPKSRSDVLLDYPLVKNLELDMNVQIPQLPPDNYFLLDTVGTKIKPQVNGRVVGPLNPPNLIVFVGQVNILEGEFSYFNRKFLIKSGTIENSSPYVLDPKYEIDTEIATPIVNANIPGAQAPKDVRINLKLQGTLKSPQAPILSAEVINPTPGEQYDLNQLQILSLLAFGNIASPEGQAKSSTSETATYFIMRQTETFVGTQIASKLNLSELQLGISDKEDSAPQFRVTKEISSQWAVTYMSTYSLSAKPYLLGIEYKLDKNVSLAGSRNEYGKYGVNLKYGIEW